MISWKVQNEKFCTKIKNLKFGPKKPSLDFLDWNLEKLMSFLKSAPSNLFKLPQIEQRTTITATTKKGTKTP